ncbi:hypothetical protein BCR44DRAFT_1441894 [Catenaria anguillulae PL171]|uniref:Uncharacterized protein n=1 Tax=Catenaria anguillulae PL171 TaxID=765915 RepID=A0A1Y2HD56_9FUNG|nr:hypothetical protein BCR44DRAFT_1441894 [Catenaria anguillulae PL171]
MGGAFMWQYWRRAKGRKTGVGVCRYACSFGQVGVVHSASSVSCVCGSWLLWLCHSLTR